MSLSYWQERCATEACLLCCCVDCELGAAVVFKPSEWWPVPSKTRLARPDSKYRASYAICI